MISRMIGYGISQLHVSGTYRERVLKVSNPNDPTSTSDFPDSNADNIVLNLEAKAELAEVLSVALARIKEIEALDSRGETWWKKTKQTGVLDEDEGAGAFAGVLYETTCLKWFLSRLFKQLSENLEYSVYQAQRNRRPIRSIVFTSSGDLSDWGHVESYTLG